MIGSVGNVVLVHQRRDTRLILIQDGLAPARSWLTIFVTASVFHANTTLDSRLRQLALFMIS